MQFYPWQHLAAEMWRKGEAPLWNPLVGNGAPLAANLQTGAFYPLNALHLILPTEQAMSFTVALHVVLAGLFMFAFLRAIGLRPFSALVGAIAFQLSGFFIARLGFLSITVTFPWLAAWLWRAERLLQSGRLHDVLWLSIAAGLGLLAGHAQTALYGLTLLAAYIVYRSVTARRHLHLPHGSSARFVKEVQVWRPAVLSFSSVLLGIALAAAQLLPAAELARESQRSGGLDYNFAMTHSYWPWRLLTLFAPDLFGNPAYGNFWGYDNYWENAAYIGLLPLALAMSAVRGWWRSRRRMSASREGGGIKEQDSDQTSPASSLQFPTFIPLGLAPFFALSALVSLILAFGWFTPIYPFLFRVLPGLSMFQGPARWLCVFTVALCALAGLGAEAMPASRGDLRRSARWIVIGIALAGAGLAARSFLAGRAATFADPTLRLGLLAAAGGLLFGLRPPAAHPHFQRWAAAFMAVVAIDLLTAHAALNPAIDPELYRGSTRSAEAIRAGGGGRTFMFAEDDEAVRRRAGIWLPFADFGPSRVEQWMPFRETLIANTSMIDGLASAGNFDSLLVGNALRVRDAVDTLPLERALGLLNLMHVRYVASPRALDLPIVHQSDWLTIYRNDEALPRAWIVYSARVEADPLMAILDPTFDPREEVILEESSLPSTIGHAQRPTAIRDTPIFLQDTPNAVTIRAASERDGYLILADTWYPGWRAFVDGIAVDVLRANAAFRAIAFPAGEHLVEFRYEPAAFRTGAWVTLASAALIAAGLLRARAAWREAAAMRGSRLRPWHIAGAAGLVYVGLTLARFGADPKAFAVVCPDPARIMSGRCGYDGQFAYVIATDPMNAAEGMDAPAYRYQRILYPVLARTIGLGQPELVGWALVLVNLVALTAGTALLEAALVDHGASRWYALAYGLFAGTMMPVRLDLTEPLAYALAMGGALAAMRDRWTLAGGLLALAALTKETTLLFAAGIAGSCLLQRRFRAVLEVAVLAVAPFSVWQLVLRAQFGQFGIGSGGALGTPFEFIPLRGWWSLASVNLNAFALISLIMVPMAILPALAGLWAALRDFMQRRFDLPAALLFFHAALVLVTPQSTFREPLGMARLMVGLVAATVLYAAARRSTRGLNYSLLWIFTLALALNESSLPM